MKNNIYGIDHIGLTVPDLDQATQFFIDALNAEIIYDMYKKSEPIRDSEFTKKRLGIPEDMAERAIRMIGLPDGPQIELFEFSGPDQHGPVNPADFGWQHVAFNVNDIDPAVNQVEKFVGKRNTDPVELSGLEAGEGNKFLLLSNPMGFDSRINFISDAATVFKYF